MPRRPGRYLHHDPGGGFGATVAIAEVRSQAELDAAGELPPWLGDEAFHRSHQAALVKRDPDHYRPLFPDVPDDLPYVWPASDRDRRIPF